MMETVEPKNTRRRFLRQLAIGLGAGLGVLAAPAIANASVFVCCPDPSACPSGHCPQGTVRYLCRCSQWGLPPDYCTGCQADHGCYDGPC